MESHGTNDASHTRTAGTSDTEFLSSSSGRRPIVLQKPLAAHPASATLFDEIEESIRIKIQQKDAYKRWMAASNKTSVKYSNKTFEKGNSVHEAKFFKMMEKNVLDNRKTAEKRANKRKAKEPHERQYNEETVKALPTFKRWELLSPGVILSYKQKLFKKGAKNAEKELIKRMIENNMSSQKQYMTLKAKKSKTMSDKCVDLDDMEDQSIFENLSNADSNGVTDMVTQVYKIIRKATKDMRPGVTGDGVYGELRQGSMANVVESMQTYTDLNAGSYFLDIGSGLGKPNFNVAQEVGCVSIGIEAEPIRYFLGLQNLIHVINSAESNKRFKSCCNFICGDIVNYFSFDPFTHVYIFSYG